MAPLRIPKSKSQTSLELLITLSFGLLILLPIVALAFLQVSNTSAALAASQAQETASKLASVAAVVGTEGSPAKQLVLIEVPPNVKNVFVGNLINGVGHEVIFVVRTGANVSYVTSYTPVNVSGYLEEISLPGSYLINVSSQSSCPSDPAIPCVYMVDT